MDYQKELTFAGVVLFLVKAILFLMILVVALTLLQPKPKVKKIIPPAGEGVRVWTSEEGKDKG